MPTEQKLEEDFKIMKRIQYLQTTVDWNKLTEKQKITMDEELKALSHRYYVENADIRRYWKTR